MTDMKDIHFIFSLAFVICPNRRFSTDVPAMKEREAEFCVLATANDYNQFEIEILIFHVLP
jgi:hypothetical protein